MSAAIYPTRLYWVGLRRCARLDGRDLRLDGAPTLQGVPQLQAIDYAPGACAMLMERGQPWRDMTEPERHAVLELLRHLPPAQAGQPAC